MSDLARKFPNTFIGRVTALRGLKMFFHTSFGSQVGFPPDVVNMLSPAELPFINDYSALIKTEAEMLQKLEYKAPAFDKLKLFTISFLAVMKYAVKRSLILKDGKWSAADIAYYNLDETAGKIPAMKTHDEVKRWAEMVVNGEQKRLLANAAAVPMSNPSAAEVQAMLDAANLVDAPFVNASLAYNAAQAKLRKSAKETDRLLRTAWRYLDAYYSHLPMESKRNALRIAGVVYYNTGKATVLSVVVKDAAGKPLQGARATLMQTGGSTTANKEGRINLKTKTDGEVQMQITYPTKQTATVSFNITKADAGTTISAAEVVMG